MKAHLAICCLLAFVAHGLAVELPPGPTHTNSLGMKLVRIQPGEFVMGTGEGVPRSRAEWEQRDADEVPAHPVKISRPLFLGALEVTNAQYEQFDPAHKDQRGRPGATRADDEPVTFVTWQQAADFCAWLAKKEGLPYRLPTEAEWEYACRAGTTTPFAAGAALTAEHANLGTGRDGKKQAAVPVGQYPANAWGLHDMHGNVAEWCHDWYGPYAPGPQADPVGRADGYARVVRGWSYYQPTFVKDSSRYARSANRSGHLPEDANRYTGFRIALGDMPATPDLPAAIAPHQASVQKQPASRDGPDPARPYFVDFGKEGKNAKIPAETWGPIFSQWNHYAACCVCPNGDVLAAWYTTVSESGRELAQAASRLRAGSDTWEPASLFFDVPDVNDHAPVLLRDGGRIWHFCTQSLHGWDHASDIVRWSDDSGATWSRPRIMLPRDDPRALSQPCSAFVASDGTIVLACDGDNHRDERLLIGKDRGQSWQVAAGDMRATVGKYAIHPAIAPRADGTILAFLRGPDPMALLSSADLGATWKPEPCPFPGISVGQKAAVKRLASGALLLCSIDRTRQLVGGGTFAALSLDDGKTWPHVRKLTGPTGYMAVDQAPDGLIYLFGSRMSCAAFNEAWVKEKLR